MDLMKERMRAEQQGKRESFGFANQLAKKGETLFVGSSLMEQFPIQELLQNKGIYKYIYNRGIGGYTTDDMLESMEEQVFGLEPSRIFINIGTNDIASPNYTLEKLIGNYRKILQKIKERLPKTTVYLMAYYPVNEVDKVPQNDWGKRMFETRNNTNIKIANEAVKELAKEMEYYFIDVNEGLEDERGMLKKEYTMEGVHMYATGYEVILNNMLKYGVLE